MSIAKYLSEKTADMADNLCPVKRERRKDARPGELLEAALDLFVEKGFAATRAEEVARRAGVSKGTLFLYFQSKEELFKAVVQDTIAKQVRQGAVEVAAFEGSSTELLRHLLMQWWVRYGDTKASGITKLMISEANNFPELAQYYQNEVVKPGHAMLCQVLQRGIARGEFRSVDVHHTAYTLVAPLVFLIMWKHSLSVCCGTGQHIDPVQFIQQHADVVVRGLCKDHCK